jgi:hypothetical protein
MLDRCVQVPLPSGTVLDAIQKAGLMTPRQLCNSLLHKFLFRPSLGKGPHIFKVARTKAFDTGKLRSQIPREELQMPQDLVQTVTGLRAMLPSLVEPNLCRWVCTVIHAPVTSFREDSTGRHLHRFVCSMCEVRLVFIFDRVEQGLNMHWTNIPKITAPPQCVDGLVSGGRRNRTSVEG